MRSGRGLASKHHGKMGRPWNFYLCPRQGPGMRLVLFCCWLPGPTGLMVICAPWAALGQLALEQSLTCWALMSKTDASCTPLFYPRSWWLNLSLLEVHPTDEMQTISKSLLQGRLRKQVDSFPAVAQQGRQEHWNGCWEAQCPSHLF